MSSEFWQNGWNLGSEYVNSGRKSTLRKEKKLRYMRLILVVSDGAVHASRGLRGANAPLKQADS